MDIPVDLAHRWHERHDACLADVATGAAALAAVYDELHRLAVQDGPPDLAAELGATAHGLRTLTNH